MRMPRRHLPPPPPPAHLRAWHDEAVLRDDRATFLAELARQSLGLTRLLLLWSVAAVFAFGWSFLGMALMSFEQGDGLGAVIGAVFAALGFGVLVPAGFWFAWGARRDREVRQLLCAWAESEPPAGVPAGHPAAGLRLCAPGRSLGWLLSSAVLCAAGLWVAFGWAASARPDGTTYATYAEVAYYIGLGMILWVTGLLGAGKAAAHYRWAARVFTGPATRASR
ncbi:hypothetical protein DEJ50_19660 [Streptomyces venezuelae]|uniref:Uncharacterized protein n=2 Tax=Streptomyces venezuelae TaxID=54571 RepID=A0A5P2DEI3_STRVZ|nr:hypothetical protein DEJ50_19660 [Streptomyces venezuelae]